MSYSTGKDIAKAQKLSEDISEKYRSFDISCGRFLLCLFFCAIFFNIKESIYEQFYNITQLVIDKYSNSKHKNENRNKLQNVIPQIVWIASRFAVSY